MHKINGTHRRVNPTEPTNSTTSTLHQTKSVPPVLITGGLPPVPARLVKRMQEGLFVEMAELLLETLSSSEYAAGEEPTAQKQKLREVSNIVDWVQCFGIFNCCLISPRVIG